MSGRSEWVIIVLNTPTQQFFIYILHLWWDDDGDVLFVLDEHTELDFSSANSTMCLAEKQRVTLL